MTTSEKYLAERLLLLPLDLQEKVLLWLTYRGLKTVSDICVLERDFNLLQQGKFKTSNKVKAPKIKKIKKWLQEAGLFYVIDRKRPTSWYVGKEENKARLLAKIIHGFDYQSEYQTGLLFGFPKSSAQAYAYNCNVELGKEQIPMVWPGFKFSHVFLKNKASTLYLIYALRADQVKEDIKIAKQWAATVRKEVPLLAKAYEKHVSEEQKGWKVTSSVWRLRIKRNNQTIKEIMAEYLKEGNSIREIFLRAFREFDDSALSEFQFASVCYHLRRQNKSSTPLAKMLKLGENIYLQHRQRKGKILVEEIRRMLGE